MKPEGVLIAERLAAQHCRELLRGGIRATDPIKDLDRLGDRIAELMGPALTRLCAGQKLAIRTLSATQLDGSAALLEKLGPSAVINLVTAGDGKAPLILALPANTVIGFLDLAYGGNGEVSDPVPEKLSGSAMLIAGRIQKLLGEALSAALDPDTKAGLETLCHGCNTELLAPFAECRVSVLSVEMKMCGLSWEAHIGFPAASLAELFGRNRKNGNSPTKSANPASPKAAPFAAIPLPLRAVLVDMAVPVSLLTQLKPGQILPISVSRSVPLMVGEHVVAHGTVGAIEDRAALQLTQITGKKEN